MLGQAGALPKMVAGIAAEPGEVDQARVWTNDGGVTWNWKELPVRLDGDADVFFAATDGVKTWVGGTATVPGGLAVPFVAESPDRKSWSRLALPQKAVDAAFTPGSAVSVDGQLLLVGTTGNNQPALVTPGEGGTLTALPAPPEGRQWSGFAGVAAQGQTVVAVGEAALPGQTKEAVVYRSEDAGATWTAALGPAQGPAGVTGIAVVANQFVVTGGIFDDTSRAVAAAWSSPDGATWTAETMPTFNHDQDQYAPSETAGYWLTAPSVTGDRLVAPMMIGDDLRLGALQRDPNGAWRLLGQTADWVLPGANGIGAVNEDGTVLLAQFDSNAGRLQQLSSSSGSWSDLLVVGEPAPGVKWSTFLDPEGSPDLVGYTTVTTAEGNGGWTRTSQLSRFTFDSTGSLLDAAWDPAESANVTKVSASSPQGATVALGERIVTDAKGEQDLDSVGWFRPAPDAPWQALEGLASPRSEEIEDVAWINGTWVAVGASRETFRLSDRKTAAIWTSADGVRWSAAQGPFAAPEGGWNQLEGVCPLPRGQALAVGHEVSAAQIRPAAWRLSDGLWQRLDAAALGDKGGWLSSCTTVGDTTLLQGGRGDRSIAWRTQDGTTFTANELGKPGDDFGPIRAVDGGFAAAGTRSSDGRDGAVVWLSKDATTWQPVPLPSTRMLDGADVKAHEGRLIVAANSETSPEVWTLDNPAELLNAQ
ncbi:hypothetical protein [Kineococcus xinjiangensis]|uniref:hypothetical protein n=1 Tax=Kineococcus xinjiangensis TaxID=512762 RepID=UPI0011B08856|nr:hypothetical protein [Kineococcus xinjiangensis]